MLLTVKQAGEATGKSKPTIMRAIQGGKLSASRDEHTGVWKIDPAELHRVFPPVAPREQNELPHRNNGASDTTTELELLRRIVADKDAVIDDLRRRLDGSDEERRKVQAQLTALLTDQRAKPRKWSLFGKRESV